MLTPIRNISSGNAGSIPTAVRRRIVVAVTNDLLTDQRVDRTCRAMVEAGWEPLLVGRRLPGSGPLRERPYATRRMRLLFRRSALFYAEYNLRLFLFLLTHGTEAVYANDTDTLLACTCAARIRRLPLLFDAHELFTEVPELVGRPRVQSVWAWVERRCLPRVAAAFTVCQSVADEFHRRYGVKMRVMRNLPDATPQHINISTYQHLTQNHTLLYQGAVNIGRGVREVIDALQFLPCCRLVVAGDGDQRATLQLYAASLPWGDRIQFVGRKEPEELHQLTRQSSLGLCLLEDLGLNYRYSLPNRVGDFAQAGVPLLATDFPEIARVLRHYGIGTLVPPCPKEKQGEIYDAYVRQLADHIQTTLDHWSQLSAREKERLFGRASDELCWQKEKSVLIDTLNTIIP